jgi:hypothetical protein
MGAASLSMHCMQCSSSMSARTKFHGREAADGGGGGLATQEAPR